ncbi:MAG: diguanylate cyclase [Fibrobacterota bacterium]
MEFEKYDPDINEVSLPADHTIEKNFDSFADKSFADRISSLEKTYENEKSGNTFYSDLVFSLSSIKLSEKKARSDWKNILEHKFFMSEKLGRNVGIQVACLDYYTNIKQSMTAPRILDIESYKQTVRQAITDSLTYCYTRKYFNYRLRQIFTQAKNDETGAFSLIMLDVDYFKQYNDTNGHIKGDLALIQISRIMNAVASQKDIICRYGGEEFIIILPESGSEKTFTKAELLREAVYDYRFNGEREIPGKRLTISIGTSIFFPEMEDPEELVSNADKALFYSKENGRNRTTEYSKIG